MAINKKIIENIVPVLQSLSLSALINASNDDVFLGRYMLENNEGRLLVFEKHNIDIKVSGKHRNFIIIDLDDTAFPVIGYEKDRWKQKVLVLRNSCEGLKFICVASKSGELCSTNYFASFFS